VVAQGDGHDVPEVRGKDVPEVSGHCGVAIVGDPTINDGVVGPRGPWETLKIGLACPVKRALRCPSEEVLGNGDQR
jgi:hypothetical protein